MFLTEDRQTSQNFKIGPFLAPLVQSASVVFVLLFSTGIILFKEGEFSSSWIRNVLLDGHDQIV